MPPEARDTTGSDVGAAACVGAPVGDGYGHDAAAPAGDLDATASGDPAADWARSGVVTLTGRSEGPPLVPPGRAATVAGRLAERFARATGVRVDGASLLAERTAFTGHRRRGPVSAGGACRLLPTADGWAAISCARPDDPALLGALAGAEVGDDPWPAVTGWLREHTGAELTERAELLGVAAGPVVHRFAPPVPITERVPLIPRPVEGLLVVDFSALWAGPLCAHLLGLAGARVVKVETPWRPDGARRGDPEFYRLLHAGHRAVALDPHTAPGRHAMAELVAAADIVIEASRPRALARFGLDAEAAVAAGTTWISITAYGRASDRVGFGDDIAAGNGLVAWAPAGPGRAGTTPLFCGDAIADPLTGLTAAVLAASAVAGRSRTETRHPTGGPEIPHREAALGPHARSATGQHARSGTGQHARSGTGTLWDIAMSDVVAATLGPAPSRAVPARRESGGWVVDTASGPVPVAPPRRRHVPGQAAALGRHTHEVLTDLGITPPPL